MHLQVRAGKRCPGQEARIRDEGAERVSNTRRSARTAYCTFVRTRSSGRPEAEGGSLSRLLQDRALDAVSLQGGAAMGRVGAGTCARGDHAAHRAAPAKAKLEPVLRKTGGMRIHIRGAARRRIWSSKGTHGDWAREGCLRRCARPPTHAARSVRRPPQSRPPPQTKPGWAALRASRATRCNTPGDLV